MQQIALLEPGGSRTLLSAETGNELIRALNAWQNAVGKNGIDVKVADGNVVLSFTGNSTSSPNSGGVGSGDAWTFRGDWVNQAYNLDDVVIVDTAANIESADVAGTYLAILDVPLDTPAPGTTGSETFWSLLSRGNWQRLKFRFPGIGVVDIDCRGTELTSGGQPRVLITSEVDTSSVSLSLADLGGHSVRFRPVGVCENGIAKTMIVLGSTSY